MKYQPGDTIVATEDIKMSLVDTEMTLAHAGERLVILDGGPVVWRVAPSSDPSAGFHCLDKQIRPL